MERKQALVIGLGRFGAAVTRALYEAEVEVLAVDYSAERAQAVAAFATEVAAFDATNETALAKAAPDRRDICICAIGDESREASILCTALLRQLGAKRIFSRAADELHQRILRLVGAHEVANPEDEFGRRIALHLAHAEVQSEFAIHGGLILSEFELPESVLGRNLIELELRAKYGVTVIALTRGGDTIASPDPKQPLLRGDRLVVVANPGRVAEFMRRFG